MGGEGERGGAGGRERNRGGGGAVGANQGTQANGKEPPPPPPERPTLNSVSEIRPASSFRLIAFSASSNADVTCGVLTGYGPNSVPNGPAPKSILSVETCSALSPLAVLFTSKSCDDPVPPRERGRKLNDAHDPVRPLRGDTAAPLLPSASLVRLGPLLARPRDERGSDPMKLSSVP